MPEMFPARARRNPGFHVNPGAGPNFSASPFADLRAPAVDKGRRPLL